MTVHAARSIVGAVPVRSARVAMLFGLRYRKLRRGARRLTGEHSNGVAGKQHAENGWGRAAQPSYKEMHADDRQQPMCRQMWIN